MTKHFNLRCAAVFVACLGTISAGYGKDYAAGKSQQKQIVSRPPLANADSKRKSHRRQSKTKSRLCLVPPPPAYMPSILPELRRSQPRPRTVVSKVDGADGNIEEIAENPYQKYVQTPDGQAPEPLQQSKGVVTWAHRRTSN